MHPSTRGSFDRISRIVDIGRLSAPDRASRRAVARELDAAARTAVFPLRDQPSASHPSVSRPWSRAAGRFFALTDEAKRAYYIGRSRNHRGYVPPGEEVFYSQSKDTKEAFDLALDLPADDPDYLAGQPPARAERVAHRDRWIPGERLRLLRGGDGAWPAAPSRLRPRARSSGGALRRARDEASVASSGSFAIPRPRRRTTGRGLALTPTTSASPSCTPPRPASRS